MFQLGRQFVRQSQYPVRGAHRKVVNKSQTKPHIPTPGLASNKYADPVNPVKPYQLAPLEIEQAAISSPYTARILEAMGHKETKNYKEMGERLQQLAADILVTQSPLTWEMKNALRSYISHVDNPRYSLAETHQNTEIYNATVNRLQLND